MSNKVEKNRYNLYMGKVLDNAILYYMKGDNIRYTIPFEDLTTAFVSKFNEMTINDFEDEYRGLIIEEKNKKLK